MSATASSKRPLGDSESQLEGTAAKKTRIDFKMDSTFKKVDATKPASLREQLEVVLSKLPPERPVCIQSKLGSIVAVQDAFDAFESNAFDSETSLERMLNIALHPGVGQCLNIAWVRSARLQETPSSFLVVDNSSSDPSLFYMVGFTGNSSLLTKSKSMNWDGFQISVTPLELTWARGVANICEGFNLGHKIMVSDVNGGVNFSTSTFQTLATFPQRPAVPVHPRDGSEPFQLMKIGDLPILNQELPPSTPVLVVFTVNHYQTPSTPHHTPTKGSPGKMNKIKKLREDGFENVLSFNVQEVVSLVKIEQLPPEDVEDVTF